MINRTTVLPRYTKRQFLCYPGQYAVRQILLAPANSKLCFLLHKINFAAKNKLAPPLRIGDGFPPKSEILLMAYSNGIF